MTTENNVFDKNRWIFIILCLSGLGAFGLQYAYVGKIGWAILFLLTFWTGIPMLLSIISGIMWIFNTDKLFAEQFVREGQLLPEQYR